jgi:hypothetical protein
MMEIPRKLEPADNGKRRTPQPLLDRYLPVVHTSAFIGSTDSLP